MNIVVNKDIGAVVDLVRIGAASTLTAGGAGDATAVVGTWLDRENLGSGYSGGSIPMSALVSIAYTATLAAGKALAMALLVEDSADGVTPNTYQTITAQQAALSAAGGTVNGQIGFHVNLGSARRFVRFTWTPDLNNTTTDTASIFPMCALGGFDRLPSPN
jgi:hypothetical protein